MTDQDHINAITQAIAAAFIDTDCAIGPFEVKAIVDAEWAAQNDRTMRAIMVDTPRPITERADVETVERLRREMG